MGFHITQHRKGFTQGYTPITTLEETDHPTGMEMGVLKLNQGTEFIEKPLLESAYLVMDGQLTCQINEEPEVSFHRTSLFNESASCIHISRDTPIRIYAKTDCELTLYRTNNDNLFPHSVYHPPAVANEHRGKGQLQDTAYRYVRTIFDKRNAPDKALLVLGEVITFPGRWSSYPPHHHPQAEIYHYRFDKPTGYGHGELGEDVFYLKHYDTLKILHERDHAQCAAPGYAMYYSWVIRHLPGNPYITPTFTEIHEWTQLADATAWEPR